MPTAAQVKLHRVFKGSWKIVLSVILIAPILKWYFIVPAGVRFADFNSIAAALGQVAGIVGTLLFSFSLILSYRNRVFEMFFGGLDTLYRIHHKAGMYGLFLLLLHPVLLSLPLLAYSVEAAAAFFSPIDNSTAIIFGIFSLLAFIILIAITLFGVMFSYPALKVTHKFLGAAFLLGAVHGFMIPGDIADDMFIRIWVLGFAFTGIFCFIWYSLLKKFTVKKYKYIVSFVKKVSTDVMEITLTPQGLGISHLPGQFVFVTFINSAVVSNESHPFTVSSWKGDGTLVISSKTLGDYTSQLINESNGTLVDIEGPYGEFSYIYGDQNQVWIAGGIGVTPFVAMVENLLTMKDLSYNIEFFYSAKTKEDLAYNELFEKVANTFPSFKYYPMSSITEGFISGDMLFQKVLNIRSKDIFICGPPMMMNMVKDSLVSLGIKRRMIHSELFSLLK